MFSALGIVPRADAQVLHESQKLRASDPIEGQEFGYSVSVSGDFALIGAHFDDDIGEHSGAAYVFRSDGSTWSQFQKLLSSDGGPNDEFGASVSISGEWAVVGAPFDDGRGSAYLFRWDGSLWLEQQKLLPSDGAASDRFGIAVSLSQDVLIVGASGDDDLGSSSGSAYVFRWNGISWVEEQKLLASDGTENDRFGFAVSVSGDVAVVGAMLAGGDTSGTVYVFRWSGSSWAEEQTFRPWAWPIQGQVMCVSNSDDVIVIGGATFDPDMPSVYVFRWNPGAPGSWLEEQLMSTGIGAFAVSISGDVIVVGRATSAFRWNGSLWNEEYQLQSSDRHVLDHFGTSVAVFGEVAFVGAYHEDDFQEEWGAAYVFNLSCDPEYYGPMCLECPGGADHPCSGHGTCDDGPTGTGCMCDSGWIGADCGTDIDECAVGTICNLNATCVNTPGSFHCDCNPGFSGDGVYCTPAPSGACCDGSTCSTTTFDLCPGGATFLYGAACEGVAACCLPDESCIEVDAACCRALGGNPARPGLPCGDDGFHPCAVPIPTVSGWGILVMTLLTLVGAKLAFRSRQANCQ